MSGKKMLTWGRRLRRLFAPITVVASFSLVLVVATSVSADLTTISPSPDDMNFRDSDQGCNPANQGRPQRCRDATRHILITSDHGDAYAVKFGIYLPSTVNASRTVRIVGGEATNCYMTDTPGGTFRPTRNVYEVVYETVQTADNRTYRDVTTVDYADTCNTNTGKTMNKPFPIPDDLIRYSVPTDRTGGQYKQINMTVRLVCRLLDNNLGVGERCAGPGGYNTHPNVTRDNMVDGTMTFAVELMNVPNGLIGVVDSADTNSDRTPNNSYTARHNYADQNDDATVDMTIPFGIDCQQQAGLNRVMSFRDADNSNNIDIRFTVQMRTQGAGWRQLRMGTDLSAANGDRFTVRPDGWIRPNNLGSGGNNVKINILNMGSPASGTLYRLLVRGLPVKNHNYVYVGLPGDSIYGTGNITCQHSANPTLTLTPGPSDVVQAGEAVSTTAGIRNTGVAPAGLQYQHRIWYRTGTSNRDLFGAGDSMVQDTGWRTRTPAVPPGAMVNVNTFNVGAIAPPAGARFVCASIELRNNGADDTVINPTTDVKCTNIGKAPSFAVPAGSVRTGGAYSCSVTKPVFGANPVHAGDWLSPYYGVLGRAYPGDSSHSYVTDGVLALGQVAHVSTAINGPGSDQVSSLSFARQPSQAAGWFYGSFDDIGTANPINTHCLSPVFAAGRYPAATASANVGSGGAVSLPAPTNGVSSSTHTVCNGTVNMNGLTVGRGQRYIVRIVQRSGCGATSVQLNGDIAFAGANMRPDELPQFVLLVEGSTVGVRVAPGVSRLDGVYAINSTNPPHVLQRGVGSFLTCSAIDTSYRQLSANACQNRLTVNGTIITSGRIEAFRTGGHDTAADTSPAETFNLRPDVILSDAARNSSVNRLETVHQQELAPRY